LRRLWERFLNIFSFCGIMDKSDSVLEFLGSRGPSLPVAVAKELGTDTIIAGAYLSTLLSRKMIKVSYLKVGGSPLYFLKGQEAKLQGFSDKLNPVDRKTYELLKERKVLRENELEPIERVSLKQLRDFAVPLNVRMGNDTEVFWKWYLLPEEETAVIVRKALHIVEAPKAVPSAREEPRAKEELRMREEPRVILKPVEKAPIEKKEVEAPRKEIVEERKRDEITRDSPISNVMQEKPAASMPHIPTLGHVGSQRVLIKENELKDRFFDQIREYFSRNMIDIIETNILKKGVEIDMLIEVPSAVGRLTYYCKAKNKKRSNEGDLAATFVQAQMRKMPALYLTRGDITKKAEEMLSREFKGLIFRKF
jgi:hypothetical protein